MKKPMVGIFSVLGVLFLVLAVYYWMTPAGSLPHFLPGYQVGGTQTHVKHGLAALILAIGCGVVAWFSLGRKSQTNEQKV